eukprot:7004980-Prymnesium_polylepis.1
MCGKGAETGYTTNEAIVLKVSSAGSALWAWRSGRIGGEEVCNGVAQLPNGGDILVAGFETSSSGVSRGYITKLALATGAEAWSTRRSSPRPRPARTRRSSR